jgi:hypothetical protein
MSNQLWKDWTEEDWTNAVYCPTCGLPMFEVPFGEQQHSDQELKIEGGTYQCVYCTWREDDKYVRPTGTPLARPTPEGRRRKIIYIAGRYRDFRGDFFVEANIREAGTHALMIWLFGGVALCPHMNTAHFGGAHGIDDKVWLEGDIQLMKRCDAVFALPGWETSKGAVEEVRIAREAGMPVFTDQGSVLAYIEVK